MPTVLTTGGTGMIGKHLTRLLVDKGYKVIILSRNAPVHKEQQDALERITYAKWDLINQTIDKNAIAQADHIIHLAGAGVAEQRWSKQRKQEIVNSRTQSSALIVKALVEIPNNVKTVISMSAIGWYGPDTEKTKHAGFTEDAPADTAFLGETCRAWEASIEPVTHLGKRLVKLRTGIVLSNEGGAFVEFIKPIRSGIAAVLGNGKQIVSWIHVDDLCHMFIHALESETVNGVYNAVAPHPVTNKSLTIALAKHLRGKFFVRTHVPAFVLKMILGEMSIEVLKSAKISCRKIQLTGFDFLYPTLESAIGNLTQK